MCEDSTGSLRSIEMRGGEFMAIDLLPAERHVLRSFPSGEIADLTKVRSGRTIQAAVIKELLLKTDVPPGSGAALRIVGAKITGRLDLEGIIVRVLSPAQMRVRGGALLQRCGGADPSAADCVVPGLSAGGLRAKGDVELNDGFTCNGALNLLGAQVGGALRLSDAVIRHQGEHAALVLSRASVASSLLAGGLHVAGEVRMISTRIDGLLNSRGATLSNPGQIALEAERLDVGEVSPSGSTLRLRVASSCKTRQYSAAWTDYRRASVRPARRA